MHIYFFENIFKILSKDIKRNLQVCLNYILYFISYSIYIYIYIIFNKYLVYYLGDNSAHSVKRRYNEVLIFKTKILVRFWFPVFCS